MGRRSGIRPRISNIKVKPRDPILVAQERVSERQQTWVPAKDQDLEDGTEVRRHYDKKLGSVVGSRIPRAPHVMPHGDGYKVRFLDETCKVYTKFLHMRPFVQKIKLIGLEDYSGEEVTVIRRDSKIGKYDIKLERTGEVIQTYGDHLKLPDEMENGNEASSEPMSPLIMPTQLPRISKITQQTDELVHTIQDESAQDEFMTQVQEVTPQLLEKAKRGSVELVLKRLDLDFHVGDEAQVEGKRVFNNGGTPLQAGQAAANYCARLLPQESVIDIVAAVVGVCEAKNVKRAARHERGEVAAQKKKYQTNVQHATQAVEQAKKQAIRDIALAYSETEYFASDALKSQMASVRAGEAIPSNIISPVFFAQRVLRQACLQRAIGLANCPLDSSWKGRFVDPQMAGLCSYATLLSTLISCPDFDALQGGGLAARIAGVCNRLSPKEIRKEVKKLILLLDGTEDQAKAINEKLEERRAVARAHWRILRQSIQMAKVLRKWQHKESKPAPKIEKRTEEVVSLSSLRRQSFISFLKDPAKQKSQGLMLFMQSGYTEQGPSFVEKHKSRIVAAVVVLAIIYVTSISLLYFHFKVISTKIFAALVISVVLLLLVAISQDSDLVDALKESLPW